MIQNPTVGTYLIPDVRSSCDVALFIQVAKVNPPEYAMVIDDVTAWR